MSGFLARLVARIAGNEPGLRPRPPHRFASAPIRANGLPRLATSEEDRPAVAAGASYPRASASAADSVTLGDERLIMAGTGGAPPWRGAEPKPGVSVGRAAEDLTRGAERGDAMADAGPDDARGEDTSIGNAGSPASGAARSDTAGIGGAGIRGAGVDSAGAASAQADRAGLPGRGADISGLRRSGGRLLQRERVAHAFSPGPSERHPARFWRQSAGRSPVQETPSSVTVHIGRIDVMAVTSSPPSAASTPASKNNSLRRPSLEAYLQRRDRRRT